ncbi:acetyl-CoA carboxylase biotin carboxyl carrier protein subunit [Hanstruepera marina]|uniref:acetyl-CoA carboxylase biotin carboxyl carrier protein subunit n=1 Tax=Hanstruepera marina TaxID=2873265 RepID=UPI001CA75D4F|nr:acetyl-CoA carboxylase biotin carboxyl carrier protein subunit [Hanstruepera marina]
MTYKTIVNGDLTFDINQDALNQFDAIKISDSQFHVLNHNETFNAKIAKSNFNKKTYTVTVNNNTYDVAIMSDLDILIKDMGFEVGAAKRVNDVKAPMPGLILEISVKEGQEVKEDDPIIILEAMKMENVITAPRDAVIKHIAVKNGHAVDKNQLLIELE